MAKRSVLNKYVSNSASANKGTKNFVNALKWLHVGNTQKLNDGVSVSQSSSSSSHSSASTSGTSGSGPSSGATARFAGFNSSKRFQSKAWDFMGWLVKEDGSRFTNNVYCKHCLIR